MKFLLKLIEQYKKLIAIILITTLGTFFLAKISYVLLTNTDASILDLLRQWDVIRYLIVADKGYVVAVSQDPTLIAVFPLYPSLISLLAIFVKDLMLSALIISNVAFAIACLYLYKLSLLDNKKKLAINTVLYLSIFPTAYFLHTGYTESLFLALAIPSFYYARKGNWFLACVLGMISSLVRITGVALFLGLVFEYLHQRKFKLNLIRRNVFLLALIPLGLLFFLFINYHIFGDPFEFVSNQSYFHRYVAPFWEGLTNALQATQIRSPNEKLMIGYAEAIAGLIGLIASLLAFKYLRPSYAVYMIVALFIVTFNSFWIGTPRYLLSLFPMFILVSKFTDKKESLHFLLVFISLTLFTIFLSLFVKGWWAF